MCSVATLIFALTPDPPPPPTLLRTYMRIQSSVRKYSLMIINLYLYIIYVCIYGGLPLSTLLHVYCFNRNRIDVKN